MAMECVMPATLTVMDTTTFATSGTSQKESQGHIKAVKCKEGGWEMTTLHCVDCHHFSMKDAGATWASLGMGICKKAGSPEERATCLNHGREACAKFAQAKAEVVAARVKFLRGRK